VPARQGVRGGGLWGSGAHVCVCLFVSGRGHTAAAGSAQGTALCAPVAACCALPSLSPSVGIAKAAPEAHEPKQQAAGALCVPAEPALLPSGTHVVPHVVPPSVPQVLVYGDCAVNVEPSPLELAQVGGGGLWEHVRVVCAGGGGTGLRISAKGGGGGR
jgi:hypothetical protein